MFEIIEIDAFLVKVIQRWKKTRLVLLSMLRTLRGALAEQNSILILFRKNSPDEFQVLIYKPRIDPSVPGSANTRSGGGASHSIISKSLLGQ
jgi:hypothetical protein